MPEYLRYYAVTAILFCCLLICSLPAAYAYADNR